MNILRLEPRRSPLASVVLAVVLLPLAAGLAMAVSPAGREALASWWARPAGWRIVVGSLAFAGVGATVGLIAGWVVALLLPARGAARTIILTLCCLPLLVPSSLMGVGWIMALGRDAVVTNALRHVLGDATPTIFAWPVGAGATGLRYFGVAALVIAASHWQHRSTRAAERAFALSAWTRLRLRLGATRSAALVAWLLLVLLVQGDHILPGMFLVHTFGTEVLIQFTALMDPAGAAALALMPALIALLIVGMCGGTLRRSGTWSARDDATRLSSSKSSDRGHAAAVGVSLASSRAWRRAVLALVLIIAVVVPITGLVVRAGSVGNLGDGWRAAHDEVAHSITLSTAGAALTLLLSLPLAHAWVASHRARRSSPVPVALLNLAVPGSLLALGVLALPVPRALLDTDAALVFAYAARFAAVAAVALFAAWVRQSPAADAAARVHGVPALDRFIRLTIPTRGPAALAAFALVALLVAAELEMSILLVPPGPTTLGVRLYTMIHTAPDHVVAALAVDVLLTVMLVALVFATLMRFLRSRVA
jgi:iron(III) transport system permease protein